MELLDTYEELIETNPREISIRWKILQIFFYFLSVMSGYGSADLFYILWNDIFAGHCLVDVQIMMPIQDRVTSEEVPVEEDLPASALSSPDWRQKITVTFRPTTHCNLYHFVSLSSCVFGTAWMTLFAMCGKGGYDTRIFVAPWTIVPPAIIFQFIFMILVIFVVHDLEYGYSKFVNNLQKITATMNETQLTKLKRPCDILQSYLEFFGPTRHNVCQIYPALQIFSWLMAWSWILGLVVLIFRVVRIHDFKLLTVMIYKIPRDEIKKYTHGSGSIESQDGVSIP